MAANDTAAIVSALRVRAALPSNSTQALTTAQILRLLDEELTGSIVPLVKSCKQSYWITSTTQALVSGQASYRIPSRAVGGTVHQVRYVDSSGNEYPVTQTTVEAAPQWMSPSYQGQPVAYYLDGANVVVLPTPDGSGSLKMVYECRPNRLVDSTGAVGVITNINTGAKQVTVSAIPVGSGTGAANYDFVKGSSPFELLAVDQSATRSSNTFTFTNALPTGLAVGDFVNLSEETYVPQLPQDLIPLLQARGLEALLQTLGDSEALGEAKDKVRELSQEAVLLISPRVGGQAQKIVGGIYRQPFGNPFRLRR